MAGRAGGLCLSGCFKKGPQHVEGFCHIRQVLALYCAVDTPLICGPRGGFFKVRGTEPRFGNAAPGCLRPVVVGRRNAAR